MGILDGSVSEPPKTIEVDKAGKKENVHNPEYDSWIAKDQQLLSYLLNSLTKEALAPVATATTSAEAWKALEQMFSAHSRARVANLRMKLATLKKGSMSSSVYFTKMCSIKDELATVGKIVDDDEMIQYILARLDFEYNSFLTSMLGRVGSISLSDLYSQLLSYEMRLEMYQHAGQYQSSANSASRGRGGGGRGRGNRGRGNGRGSGQNRNNKQKSSGPKCQICKKAGHEAPKCWYRYDEDDEEDRQNHKTASAANTGYGHDTNWYVDSGASNHITSELEKMTVRDKYHGRDQVHTANGSGMRIVILVIQFYIPLAKICF